jgi:hypothetical protein
MDVPDYRSQYEAELDRVAREQVGFRELADRPAGAARDAAAASTAPADDDDLAAAVAVLRDPGAEPRLQTEALAVIAVNVEDRPELVNLLLERLADGSVPASLRGEFLDVLQQIAFRIVLFPAKRPDYLATLRSIVDDPDARLRRRAIGILAREKDEYVQRRLIEGLEQRARALVPPAKAIQFLGYDLHAEYFPLLRQIVERPPSRAAKREAVRLLAADPASSDLLTALLDDRREHPDIRRAAAVALQALAPDRFLERARRIVLAGEEDDQLRALSVSALTLFANPAELGDDTELARRIEQLHAESGSRPVRQATATFMARHGA